MQFNSIEFIFYFLPLFLAANRILPRAWRDPVLMLGSLIFYAFSCGGNYWWVALLAGMTILVYFAARSLTGKGCGWLLGVYLTLMAELLIFFKLYDGGKHLPAGMSFYLFQLAAYLIDTYRLRCVPDKNFFAFGAQITMFPKLLSGPLMDPRQLQLQTQYRKGNALELHDGLQDLIIGLGLKVLLGDRMTGLWTQAEVLGYEGLSVPFAWLSLIGYALRLYFDFYGYSMMAIGLGKMLGYDLPRNFLDPYISRSVSEFYRRWHATLGAWFREYIYFPMGGSRCSTLRTILNLCVVWLFTGLWHGTGGNYLLWAGFLCFLIINERLWLGKILKKTRVFAHVYTVFVILLSWLPFAIGDFGQLRMFAGRLFGITGETLSATDFIPQLRTYWPYLTAGVIFATPLPRKIWEKIRHTTLADLIIFCLFWVVVYFLSTAAQDPFLYFQY